MLCHNDVVSGTVDILHDVTDVCVCRYVLEYIDNFAYLHMSSKCTFPPLMFNI